MQVGKELIDRFKRSRKSTLPVFFHALGDTTVNDAALGGRVYGAWAEKPPNPKSRGGTIVRVGTADFEPTRPAGVK